MAEKTVQQHRDKPRITIGPGPGHERQVKASLDLLQQVFSGASEQPFAVRLWSGDQWTNRPDLPPVFTIVLNEPWSMRRMFLPPSQSNLGEAFVQGDFDIEGDIIACTGLGEAIQGRLSSPLHWPGILLHLLALPGEPAEGERGWRGAARLQGDRHSEDRDQQAISYHYDLPGDFFGLFLDQYRQYSCAYFETGAESLDAAQEAKLNHICHKLRLKPGERLLDVGCGWGGLVRFAAKNYGVQALGITLSKPQAAYARERIAAEGLGEQARIDVRDYREVSPAESFDKIVSVGMFEHVGRAKLAEYFAHAYQLLRPGGLFLNHGIAAMYQAPGGWLSNVVQRTLRTRGDFMQRYVFPDGELEMVSDTNIFAEQGGLRGARRGEPARALRADPASLGA